MLLTESSDAVVLPRIREALLTMLEIDVPIGLDARISPPEGGTLPVQVALDPGPYNDPAPFEDALSVTGSCTNITPVSVLMTHLNMEASHDLHYPTP